MKNFLFRWKWPCGLLVAFFAVAWIGFPYLFTNETWPVKVLITVKDFSRTAENIGSANAFPDPRITHLVYDEEGIVSQVGYLYDIQTGEGINRGDQVYLYSFREKLCMSHQEVGANYALRWKYFWYCDPSPVLSTILVVLLSAFIGSAIVAFRPHR